MEVNGLFDNARIGRALRILENGLYDPISGTCQGSHGEIYHTSPDICDCPDSLKGNICKHRIAAEAYQLLDAIAVA